LTFSADVTAVGPGAGTPSGTVQFAVDGVNLGAPVPMTGGTATSPTAHLDAGSHLVTADYAGDDNFAGAMDSLTQHVIAAHTTTTVTSSPNPSVVGQLVTLHAEVTPVSPATGTPEGAIQFFIDGNPAGVFAQLDNGQADLQVSTFTVGNHSVTAKYLSGDANFITSTSDPIAQQVNKAATTVTLQSSAAPSVFGQPVTFTATVAVQAPGAGAPTGTITFTDGPTELGTVPVNSGTGFQASITTSSLSVAQHAIVATYSGDGSFLSSNGSVIQKVSRAQTSTVVTSSANPAQSGQGVTFTASVSPVAPGAGVPTGTVRFTVNGANLGAPAPVVNGVATSTTFASLSPGTYAIVATYSGDGNFVTSTGSLDQGAGQNVAKGATAMTLASNANPAAYGEPVTFTSTVSAVAPATGRPSGVVQVWEGSVLLGSTSLSAQGPNTAQATFVTSTLTPGSHAIRAVYVGNFNFEGQTASTSQTVGQVPTVTGLESSANPATFGDAVTVTAVVAPSLGAPGTPTGTVTFTEGSNILGTATLSTVQGRQQASIALTGLSAGAHHIKASYAGTASYAASTSVSFTQDVSRAASHLDAEVLITQIGDNGGRVRATLTGNDGAPLAGQTLVFTTTQNTDHGVIQICTVVTNAQGFADCDATTLIPAINLDGGYDVDFAGNANYLPAHDHGFWV
ncbi:MAG: Ig-like domain repeat protein, partial [Nocardioides sp.]|nr:Ig-like domain repeat protein [Nocardioides sp.]